MTIGRFTPMMAVIPVLAGAVLLLALASPAAAQTEACIQVLAGTGISVTITVKADGMTIQSPGTIPPGQTHCVPLGRIGDGDPFQVLAVMGGFGEGADCNVPSQAWACCTPTLLTRCANLQTSIMFFASGSGADPHCVAPIGAPPPQP